jgi:hypothetical protein
VENEVTFRDVIQISYYQNGTTINNSIVIFGDNKYFFSNICHFWHNKNDIYYDRIIISIMKNTMEQHNHDILIVYLWIIAKLFLLVITCFIFYLSYSTTIEFDSNDTILISALLILYGIIITNFMAFSSVSSFYGMIANDCYEIQGSNSIYNFTNQDEFINRVTANVDEYYHFTKCEKNSDIDIHKLLNLIILLLFLQIFIIYLFMKCLSYVCKNKNKYDL